MGERDDKGRFIPGNKTGAKGGRVPELANERKPVKSEIIKCAKSLSKPWSTLEAEIKDPNATRLEYLTTQAIANRNYKFIQWLLEMAVGRPKQTFEVEDPQKLTKNLEIFKMNGDKESLKVD